jgi:hypothetical protein
MSRQDFARLIKRWGSIMATIFDLLYREYCRARLAEMRKQLLISTESREVSEANRDAGDSADAAGRSSADGGIAAQHEAPHGTPHLMNHPAT